MRSPFVKGEVLIPRGLEASNEAYTVLTMMINPNTEAQSPR